MAATGQAAGGDGGQQAQGEGQAQQTGPDLGQLAEQVGGINSSLEDMRTFLQSNPWAQQQTQEAVQEAGGDEIDLSFLDDPAMLPQDASQRLNEVLNSAIDQRAQALVAPLQQQQTEMRRDQQARDLAGEFPELADPKIAELVAGRGGLAEQAAIALGQPALAAEPSFWRISYMAHKAAESANAEGEGSGDPGAASLESGNGAGPGLSEADVVQMVKDGGGRRGSSVLNF